jgi:uncharacterized protein (TIGR02145 family)
MKRICSKIIIEYLLYIVLLIFNINCKKEQQTTTPVVLTGEIVNNIIDTVIVSSQVLSDGNLEITERGVVVSVSSDPTIKDLKFQSGNGIGVFNVKLTSLNPGNLYNYRGYATNKKGTSYGLNKSFNTNVKLPLVTTKAITEIGTKSIRSGGNIISDGGGVIQEKGVCWNLNSNATVKDNILLDQTIFLDYSSVLNGLTPGTKYFLRAFAKNSSGTAYGDEIMFTTLPPALPVVSTFAISQITNESVKSGGNITNDGDGSIIQRGVCWSEKPNPTINDRKTLDGSGKGQYVSALSGLNASTKYYLRAYATNISGTSYGDEKEFITLLPTLPTITSTLENLDIEFATMSGVVTNKGGVNISSIGLCWNTTPGVTILNSQKKEFLNTESFIFNLTGLTSATTYYYKTYAINSVGISYSAEKVFTTYSNPFNNSLQYGSIVDIEGNKYRTIQIGGQMWMAENLKVSKFNNGDIIPNVESDIQWMSLITPAWCYYENNQNYNKFYGKLYNAFVFLDKRNVCPVGWHVPNEIEMDTLIDYYGGASQALAGGKLKSVSSFWKNTNVGATNESGFSGLPSGFRDINSTFKEVGSAGFFWAYPKWNLLSVITSGIPSGVAPKNAGASIRCLKDK